MFASSHKLKPISKMLSLVHFISLVSAFLGLFVVLDYFFVYISGFSGIASALVALGLPFDHSPSSGNDFVVGIIQTMLMIAIIVGCFYRSLSADQGLLQHDAYIMSAIGRWIVMMAFWSVLFIGIVDAIISFLRVEGLLPILFGDAFAEKLGRSAFRAKAIHFPLIALASFLAFKSRRLIFVWLAFLVIIAELLIVISRFIFSYEQVFMGDLVRFWYAALFLFASTYTLVEEGHVRVDVLYATFSEQRKRLMNILGTLLFGIPLCWVILVRGLASKTSIISSPLLNFETSQSGFGMYIKYIMAGFLLVFALSMLFQFASFLLSYTLDYFRDPLDDRSAAL